MNNALKTGSVVGISGHVPRAGNRHRTKMSTDSEVGGVGRGIVKMITKLFKPRVTSHLSCNIGDCCGNIQSPRNHTVLGYHSEFPTLT